jgi:hypothetical protein
MTSAGLKIGLGLLLGSSLLGCAGSLGSARAQAGFQASPPSAHCAGLDRDRSLFGALAETSAIIGGGTGVATIPATGDAPRIALASTTVGAAALATLFARLERGSTEAWARDCSGKDSR